MTNNEAEIEIEVRLIKIRYSNRNSLREEARTKGSYDVN